MYLIIFILTFLLILLYWNMKISNHLQPFNRSEMLVQGIMYADVDNTNFIREYDPPPSKYWLEFLKKKKVSSDFQFSRDDRFLRIHFSRGLEWELYCHDAPVRLRLFTLTFYSDTEKWRITITFPLSLIWWMSWLSSVLYFCHEPAHVQRQKCIAISPCRLISRFCDSCCP